MPRRKKGPISSENNNKSGTRNKRALQRSASLGKEKPQQRNAANARERARMRVLSRAFCRLKTTLPWVPADTKLSKLDTLRLASSYIAHLKGILQDDPYKPDEPIHPALSLTWPFGFSRVGVSGAGGSEEDDDEEDDDGSVCSSSWEEVRSMMGRRKDCVHLDDTQHPATQILYAQNHLNTLDPNPYLHENILGF